jgi:hypothetical protein
MFGNEPAIVRRPALHKSLGLVDKSIGQGITAHITYRQGFSLLFENEIDAARKVLDGARLDRASETHAVIPRRALKDLIFRYGVVVGLALAITEPSQKG